MTSLNIAFIVFPKVASELHNVKGVKLNLIRFTYFTSTENVVYSQLSGFRVVEPATKRKTQTKQNGKTRHDIESANCKNRLD